MNTLRFSFPFGEGKRLFLFEQKALVIRPTVDRRTLHFKGTLFPSLPGIILLLHSLSLALSSLSTASPSSLYGFSLHQQEERRDKTSLSPSSLSCELADTTKVGKDRGSIFEYNYRTAHFAGHLYLSLSLSLSLSLYFTLAFAPCLAFPCACVSISAFLVACRERESSYSFIRASVEYFLPPN